VSVLLTLVLAAGGAQWLGPKPPAQVTRVVTLAPSLTETIVALGAAERLVGVSRFDEQPEVAALPRVGGFNDVSIEAVLAVKPQVLVVQKSPGNQKPVETLAKLGVTVLALPLTTVEDVALAMVELGRLLHREAEAKVLVDSLAATRKQMRAEAAMRGQKPRVLFAYGFAPLVVAGPGSFAHELLEDCGAVNVAQQAPTAYPTYSLERVVALTPELVIDAADSADGREAVRSLPQLKVVRWLALPSKDLLHPGPALASGLTQLCGLIATASSPSVNKGDAGVKSEP
jgi:iron complex transport system substrate-binding protein